MKLIFVTCALGCGMHNSQERPRFASNFSIVLDSIQDKLPERKILA